MYAIGEILLVVIGILIALQINNWNENRKARKKEQILLLELKRNLNTNLMSIEKSIQMERNALLSANIIKNHLTLKKTYADSLDIHFMMIGYNEKLNLVSSAFSTMKSMGFDIIQNDSLREETVNLFEVAYPALIEQTYNLRLIQFQDMTLPLMNKYFLMTGEPNDLLIPDNYSDLLNNQEFLKMTAFAIIWKQWGIDLKEKSSNETQHLISLIDRELKK